MVDHAVHVSRGSKIANHLSCYDVPSRVTRQIWAQSRVTHLILGLSRVMQKPLCHPLVAHRPALGGQTDL